VLRLKNHRRRFLFHLAAVSFLLSSCGESEPSLLKLCEGVCIEAETATLFGEFRIESFTEASDGAYVTTPQPNETEIADLLQLADKTQRIELPVTLPEGTYKIKLWVAGKDDSDDSFYVQFDNETYFTHHFIGVREKGFFPKFSEDVIRNAKGEERLFEISEGNHLLTFYLRETGARLDRVEFELKN